MTPAQAAVLRRQIAARWPEVTDLEVSASASGGADISMTLGGIWHVLAASEDGPILQFLLSRPVPGATGHTLRPVPAVPGELGWRPRSGT